MKIKGLSENINSLLAAKNKKNILPEKTNFQDVLHKACTNIKENKPEISFLCPTSINFPQQINTNRFIMNSWGIKTIEDTLDLLENYKDHLLNPNVSTEELKKELIILNNKADEMGRIFQSEGVDKDLLKIVEEIKMLSKAEVEIINRGDYD
ncbi:MAG: hypothetical protein ACPL5I_00140 [Thermodesulfobacteriota bacterium]